MATILCLETATTNCSVALGIHGEIKSWVEENSPNYSHSEQLHVFMEQAMTKASVSIKDLDAIAVSKGPGSYTGLRIGVSAAKGLCFSLDIPLISIPTLKSMATQIQLNPKEVVIPLLDARRMEVYSCAFDDKHMALSDTKAEIISEGSFQEYVKYQKIHLVGNGAAKCKDVLTHDIFEFDPGVVPSAKEMVTLAEKKYLRNEFEDVAYFEPYYLKDFVLQGKNKT
ncbi:MAG: tRNA (adenosine(37)-N6)-threonylcarbamoyltransferase complex dimerization subunit type 1 TsaB [Bacteroidota bacterium]